MKTYKIKSSAVRAAKKEMGDDWAQFAEIQATADGEFEIILKPTKDIDPVVDNILGMTGGHSITKSVEAVQLLADQEAIDSEKAEKKAEIESRKPVHIPKLPFVASVAKESAPTLAPALPSFLKIAPPADLIVPDEAKAGDKLADAALTNDHYAVMATTICPDCGSEELYTGEVDEKSGAIHDEEHIIGCHACSWHVDLRGSAPAKTPRPRLSTAELPTKKVWHIADEMLAAAKAAGLPAPKRKDVIAECVSRGIAYGTSRTQYQHWFKTLNDSAATPIATIGKDGKISMPTK